MTLSAVHTVEVGSHEHSRAALGADLSQALHLARVVDLVEFEDAELHLLVLVLDLLGLGVCLFLTLLTATQQTQRNVQLGVVRDAAGGEGCLVLELATSEEHTLILGRDSLARFNDGLHIGDSGLGTEVQDLGTICTVE